jgi:hypothetical protein
MCSSLFHVGVGTPLVSTFPIFTALSAPRIGPPTNHFLLNRQFSRMYKGQFQRRELLYSIFFAPLQQITNHISCLATVTLQQQHNQHTCCTGHTDHTTMLLIGAQSSDNNIGYLKRYNRLYVLVNTFHEHVIS